MNVHIYFGMTTKVRFPAKLRGLLEETNESDGMWWNAEGTEFYWILSAEISGAVAEKFLRYFQHRSINTFRRQLNLYGFKRKRDTRTYWHPHFTRYGDLSGVFRRSQSSSNLMNGSSTRFDSKESAASSEPTFVSSLSLVNTGTETEIDDDESSNGFDLFLDMDTEEGREGDLRVTPPSTDILASSKCMTSSPQNFGVVGIDKPATRNDVEVVSQKNFSITGLNEGVDRDIVTASAGLLVKWEGELPNHALIPNTPPLVEHQYMDEHQVAFLDTSNLALGHYRLGEHAFEIVDETSLRNLIMSLEDGMFYRPSSIHDFFRKMSHQEATYLPGVHVLQINNGTEMITKAVTSAIDKYFLTNPRMAGLIFHDGREILSFNCDSTAIYLEEGCACLISNNVKALLNKKRTSFSIDMVPAANSHGRNLSLRDFTVIDEIVRTGSSSQERDEHLHIIKFVLDPSGQVQSISHKFVDDVVSQLRFYRGLGFYPVTDDARLTIVAKYLTFSQRTTCNYMVYDLMRGINSAPIYSERVRDEILVPLPQLLPILSSADFYADIFWMKNLLAMDLRNYSCSVTLGNSNQFFSQPVALTVYEKNFRLVIVSSS